MLNVHLFSTDDAVRYWVPENDREAKLLELLKQTADDLENQEDIATQEVADIQDEYKAQLEEIKEERDELKADLEEAQNEIVHLNEQLAEFNTADLI